jgi:glutaconate CoA-transferase subunit B
MSELQYTSDELMAVEAARSLRDGDVCFVGIGLPSTAANLARLTHAPNLVLIYESGTIGTKPHVLPLSIGDGELAETADAVVSVPEIFAYWLQGGRVDVGFLGAAQIDRFANLNTTAIGDYEKPRTRLPGAGGAPEIAASAKEVLLILKQDPRTFVERLDFLTTPGFLNGGDSRAQSGAKGAGPSRVITDLCVMEPDPQSKELTLVQLHPGVEVERVRAATGWPLRVSKQLRQTAAPAAEVLGVLRDLKARTEAAHAGSS